jgi:hypothetical protein
MVKDDQAGRVEYWWIDAIFKHRLQPEARIWRAGEMSGAYVELRLGLGFLLPSVEHSTINATIV